MTHDVGNQAECRRYILASSTTLPVSSCTVSLFSLFLPFFFLMTFFFYFTSSKLSQPSFLSLLPPYLSPLRHKLFANLTPIPETALTTVYASIKILHPTYPLPYRCHVEIPPFAQKSMTRDNSMPLIVSADYTAIE